MSNSLGNQFSKFLSSGDFYSANQIIKKARSLNYPYGLINSWENSLARLEPGHRHPLDSATETAQNFQHKSFQLNENLKEVFRCNLIEFCNQYGVNKGLIGKIVDQIFDNFDIKSGKMLIPDLTSIEPNKNLLNYSLHQYLIDNPDISEAVHRGLVPSEIDHFLRFGYFEIFQGRRYSSLCFSHERKKYTGKLLYIVDDYTQLSDEEISDLMSLQLNKFAGDIFSIKQSSVYTNDGLNLDIEQYLFSNISEYHNLCLLRSNKKLTDCASKWIVDIKLKDRSAIFGYSNTNGKFCSVTEFSRANMLASDITNGCIIINAIEALSVVNRLRDYESAYGFYHALVLELHNQGVNFCLKKEVLSQRINDKNNDTSSENNACWSPFFWTLSSNNKNKSLLTSIRSDFVRTWTNQLSLNIQHEEFQNSSETLYVDTKELVVKINSSDFYSVAVIIPFKDQIHLLVDCVESLIFKKEEINFKIYAVNNDSIEPNTFEVLEQLKDKYSDRFSCINSPGEFNYSKINNEAVAHVHEDFILLLNNDILIDSNYAITTLVKTHLFYNAIITGSKLLYPSNKIQHNGLASTEQKHIAVHSPFVGEKARLNHELLIEDDLHPWDRTHECSAVTAACLLMKRSDFLSIDGFDEQFKVAYNDVDLCFRANEKYPSRPIVCSTDLKIYHLESESRGLDIDDEGQTRLYHERVKLVNRHENIFASTDRCTGISTPFNDIHKIIKTNFDNKFIDQSYSSSSDIDLEELFVCQYDDSESKKYACIFVHYDKDALIPSDCIHHVHELSKYCDVFFVSSSESLAEMPEEIQKVEPFCKQILIRRNSGYDFGCWSHMIRKNYIQLCNYDGVLLANDSNWGPLHDFSDTFLKIGRLLRDVDFVGLTSSTTPSWHLQSFFIMYSKKVFKSSYFKQHWFNIGIQESKIEIIMSYEVSWCTRLRRLGFYGASVYGDSSASNPTHIEWERLVKSNYPYIKKELIRDNPLRVDLTELVPILSSYDRDWLSCFLEYLERYGKEKSLIAELLRSQGMTSSNSCD